MKVLIKQYIINDNFRGLGHPRGPKRTRKTLLKRWDLAKILRTGSRHVYVNIYIYIYISLYIFTFIFTILTGFWASLVAQMVKNLPAMWETWVWPPGWRDPRRRERLPTPVFRPAEFHGQRSLAGCSPWSGKESDTTERLSLHINWLLSGNNKLILSGKVYKGFIYRDKEK